MIDRSDPNHFEMPESPKVIVFVLSCTLRAVFSEVASRMARRESGSSKTRVGCKDASSSRYFTPIASTSCDSTVDFDQ